VTFVTAFARSVSQLLMSFKAFATALSTQVTSKVFSLNLAMTGTFLFSHLMCRALDGVTIGCPWPQCSEGRRRAILGYLFAGCATHLMRHLQNSTRKYRSLVSGQNSFRGQTNLKLDSIRLFGAVGVTDTSPLFPQEPPFFAVPITKFFCLPLVVQLLSAGERDLDFRPALFVKIDF
jgi:hypothetical protein